MKGSWLSTNQRVWGENVLTGGSTLLGIPDVSSTLGFKTTDAANGESKQAGFCLLHHLVPMRGPSQAKLSFVGKSYLIDFYIS